LTAPTESNQSSSAKGKQQIYDLYAVSNHFGSMNGGHYTAFCRNLMRQHKWYSYDDENVDEMPESSVNSRAAYVLFYRRRKPE